VLDVKATDGEATTGIEGMMVFYPGGERESSFKLGPGKPATTSVDTFRIAGDDVYVTMDGRESQLLYQIKGDLLLLEDGIVPGVLVFRRGPQ